jgi:hypothetical protein
MRVKAPAVSFCAVGADSPLGACPWSFSTMEPVVPLRAAASRLGGYPASGVHRAAGVPTTPLEAR